MEKYDPWKKQILLVREIGIERQTCHFADEVGM